jgi:hypothetical protein
MDYRSQGLRLPQLDSMTLRMTAFVCQGKREEEEGASRETLLQLLYLQEDRPLPVGVGSPSWGQGWRNKASTNPFLGWTADLHIQGPSGTLIGSWYTLTHRGGAPASEVGTPQGHREDNSESHKPNLRAGLPVGNW